MTTPDVLKTATTDLKAKGPMHHLVIGPRKAVTSCGLRVEANYPQSHTAMTCDGAVINAVTSPDFKGIAVTCQFCNRKIGR